MPGSLFHNFPRRLSGDAQKQAGLATLEGFLKLGFVLAPETIVLNERLQGGATGRTLTIGQKRICFTELPEDMIRAHSEVFGAFSIEFDLDGLSHAGATPVFYFPPDQVSGAGGLAAAFIVQLADAANLLNDLADMKDLIVGRDGREILELNWGLQPNEFRVPITVSTLSAVLAYFEHKHGSARNLHNIMRAFYQLFYPTHNSSRGHLDYYRQREWRIIGDIALNGQRLMRDLNQKEKDFLYQASRRLTHAGDSPTRRRYDSSW